MKMRLILFLQFLLILSSCQKVIKLDLQTDEQRLVIEGILTKGDSIHQVKITQTLDFDEDMAYPTVDNAIVTVLDNLGNAGTFISLGNGIYELNNYEVEVGRTYTLHVLHEEKEYKAQSTVPSEVLLDGLIIMQYDFGGMAMKMPMPLWKDIAGEKNYYQYELFLNGEVVKGIRLVDDTYSDGLNNERPIPMFGLETGDSLRVVFHCIDYPVYHYFSTLSQNTGSVAAPANPVSNFGNSALGYFSARVTSEQTVVVP